MDESTVGRDFARFGLRAVAAGLPGAADTLLVDRHLTDRAAASARVQKDVLFTFDERGLLGLLGRRRAVLVAARGVALGEGFPAEEYDFQTAYMSAWCRMAGITDVSRIEVEKTLYGPDADAASRTEARAAAQALAAAV